SAHSLEQKSRGKGEDDERSGTSEGGRRGSEGPEPQAHEQDCERVAQDPGECDKAHVASHREPRRKFASNALPAGPCKMMLPILPFCASIWRTTAALICCAKASASPDRSEERRVGKEWRGGWGR